MCQCKSQESQGNYGNCPQCAPKKTTPHVHAALIKAWADGAIIQGRPHGYTQWTDTTYTPAWRADCEYRIKPEPKPDIKVALNLMCLEGGGLVLSPNSPDNFIATFDRETGKLKAVELL